MTLTEVWSGYVAVLRDRAPVTAASIRPPRSVDDRQLAERATTQWTEQLREFFSLHDGQSAPTGADHFVGTLLPDMILMTIEQIQYEHAYQLERPHPIDDLGDEWPAIIEAQQAGDTAHLYLPTYVPFAKDGSTGLCYIDTRGGPKQGCVRIFGADSADEGGPLCDTLEGYLDALRISVESSTEHSGLTPRIREGALVWEVDSSGQTPLPPFPAPTVIRLPFAPLDFRPSQWTDADDIIDLEVVRRKVIDTARALHPGSVVEDARAVYQRVPRLRGANMNWWVWMDGAEVVFTAFVTGDGDEVLVVEAPTGGFTVEVGD